MAVNTTGVTPAANFLTVVWPKEASDATQAATVLANLVDRQYEDSMKSFGRTITIRDLSNPAVRIKTEDTSATWANITETQQTITISRQAYVAFLVEDIVAVQSDVDLRAKYTDNAAYSLMAFVEGDLTSGLQSLPANFSALVGTLGADVVDDDILAAKNSLDKADAPMDGRFIYCSPGFHNGLLKIDKFTRQDYVGQSNAEKAVLGGQVGKIYNAPVYMSTLAYQSVSGGAAANQAYAWFCHKRGVVLIMQRTPTIHTQYIMLETGWGVLMDTIYNFAERLIAPKTLGGGTSDDKFNAAIRAN